MAEIHFFMTQMDTIDFCRFLSDCFSCSYTGDCSDSSGLPTYVDPMEAARAKDADGYPARLFITSPLWSTIPLIVTHIKHDDGRHRSYVRQRYGGPAFDFHISRHEKTAGVDSLFSGWLSDYPWYYIAEQDTTTIDRPESMAKAYKEIVRYIKQNGEATTCIETDKRGPYVMAGVTDDSELQQGDWHFRRKR